MGYAGSKENRKGVTIKTFMVNEIVEDERRERHLQKLNDRKKASPQELREKDVMLAKAAQFVEEGIPFEMAPEELKNHHFFKVGYDVALRRQSALAHQQSQLKGKTR